MSVDLKISQLNEYFTTISTDLIAVVDVTSGETKKMQVGNFTSPITPWTSDIDADGFDLKDLSNIEFRVTTGAPANTIAAIWADAGGININVPLADDIVYSINGSPALTIGKTLTDYHVRDIRNFNTLSESGVTDFASRINLVNSSYIAWQNVADTDYTNGIRFDTDIFGMFISDADGLDGWDYFTVSRTAIEFLTGGVLEYSFTSTQADFNGNNIINSNIGHENFTNDVHADVVHVQVRNESGSAMARGDAVVVSGYSIGQDLPLVIIADSSVVGTMPCFGIIEDASLANNATGSAYISGRLEGMDTSAFSAGDVLYVSNVGTSGNTLTATKPTGTDLIEEVGEVLRSHATFGRLEIELRGVEGLPNVAVHDLSMGGFNIANVGYLESNATNPSTVGAIRLGDLEEIAFRDSSNTANFSIISDDPTIAFQGWETIEFTAATLIDATLADLQVLTLNMQGDLTMNGNDFLATGVLQFATNVGFPAGTQAYIGVSATQFIFNTLTTTEYQFNVNGVEEYTFDATAFTLSDANNIVVGTTTGTKIGTATTQKIGFWNVTPIIQPVHVADPTGGATVDAEARTAINSILAQLASLGLQAAS